MYLHEVRVKNFSIHRDTSVKLTPITVFVGPNGSGKSALFDALLNFSMLARGRLGEAFGGYPYSYMATRHRAAAKISRIGYEVTMSSGPASTELLKYKVDYSQVDKGGDGAAKFEIYRETLELGNSVVFDRDSPDSSSLKAAVKHLAGDVGILAAVRRAVLADPGAQFPALVTDSAKEISRLNKFRLEPHNLRAASALPDLTVSDPPRIAYGGENVAAALYFLEQTGSPALGQITAGLKKALPDFTGFEFNTVGTQRIGFSMQFADSRGSIPAPRLSDGQLLVVGLMTLLYGPDRPPVLMIEEPENGLTSIVQREVYSAVRSLAFGESPNRSQILLSSHSPFVLCDAWNGDDRDFVHQIKVDDGHAVVRKFSDAIAAQGIMLARDENGQRVHLGLRTAEELMAGYLL